mgnify:CR=1 FL=1
MIKSKFEYFKDTSIKFIDGDRGTNYPSKTEFFREGHCLFLDTKNVTEVGFKFDKAVFISKEKDKLLGKGKLQRGDIVLTSRGTLGNIAFYGDDIPYADIRINSGMLIVRSDTNEYSPYYLYIFLRSNIFKWQYERISSGSAQPQLPVHSLKNASILKRDLDTQRKIEECIRCLDDKIKLNSKIESELEEMTKSIYNYWFVQFDFPDENGKPYKSSGGKMVFNQVLKREIPDGWNVISLGNIIVKSGTGLNPRDNFKLGEGDNYYITIKNIKNGKIIFNNKTDRISDKSLEIINKRSDLQIGDILFTSIDPVGITYFIQEKPKNWNINESVFSLRANKKLLTPEFLLILLSSKEMKVYTRQSSAGSIHKGIRHEVLKDFKLSYGGMPIILSFTTILKPLLERQHILDAETQKLTELRDWLLPMLMNGQVRVSEAS